MLTSAVNSRFGVYTPEQRLQQTLDTVASVKQHVPDAKIIIVEQTGVTLTTEQQAILEANCDILVDQTQNPALVEIYNSTDNWDIVKSTSEVLGFGAAMSELLDSGKLADVDRMFKLSGRYLLSDNFNIKQFDDLPGRIIVAKRRQSQFPLHITNGQTEQYMSRLWSWPANVTDRMIEMYNEGFLYQAQLLAAGGYCDIEHMLFKFLPQDLVTEVDVIGVKGNIAPNGVAVED